MTHMLPSGLSRLREAPSLPPRVPRPFAYCSTKEVRWRSARPRLRAGTFRVIVTGVGRCVMIGAHVQDEEWGAFGGDCRMAG